MRREPRQATTNQATTNQSDVFRLTEELLRLPRRRPYRYSKSSSNNNINNNNVLAILFSSVSSTKNKNHHQPHYDKFRRSAHCSCLLVPLQSTPPCVRRCRRCCHSAHFASLVTRMLRALPLYYCDFVFVFLHTPTFANHIASQSRCLGSTTQCH